jgi:transcriptional regulator with XRE-family HTH domain
MNRARRFRPRRPVRLQLTEAARKLTAARLRARLELRHVAAGVSVHPRTIARWERGETQPTAAQWSKTVAYLAQHVPQAAVELAEAAGVPIPVPVTPTVDASRIEAALLRAADMLDISPKRVRAAVRELATATRDAGGKLEDLLRAAQEAGA